MRVLFAASLALLASGCAAPSFVGQTGRTTPKGSVRFGAGSGYQLSTQAANVVKDGRDAAQTLRSRSSTCPGGSGQCWSQADVEPVVDAAFRFAVLAPISSHTEISGRYGLADGFDVGLHWGPDSRAIDAGFQVFGPVDPAADGWAGTVLAGYGQRSLGTLGDVIENVFQGDASLQDWQATFVAGRQWSQMVHAYVGGRYVLTHWKLQVIPDLPIVFDGGEMQKALLGTDSSGNVHQLSAVFGGAVGYKHLFVGAELNLVQTFGSAEVLFRQRDLAGFGVMPAVYVYGQY
ncbi:hypothetical protein [Anaeromyxobacter oryzae]|uniref:Lipoprotein n=1 Tax=Anaeromyxobacter oryzae TaxID=2918170 RepID=A0ABM7X4F4_9BACT|nr:hypothetical protein [Anaeromyxobacter oryzae]BDG06689.1 hypothetical protein AMOR_56850 [Anaeromyxobacter oryzae]